MMDINELIDNLRFPSWHDLEDPDATLLGDAADAPSTLRVENEKLRAELERTRESLDFARTKDAEIVRLGTELEKVKRERDAAKSPEVLEAVDELMEFARTRMSIGDWLYYVNVLGEWRGPQKED